MQITCGSRASYIPWQCDSITTMIIHVGKVHNIWFLIAKLVGLSLVCSKFCTKCFQKFPPQLCLHYNKICAVIIIVGIMEVWYFLPKNVTTKPTSQLL